jgi:hypothetical protein
MLASTLRKAVITAGRRQLAPALTTPPASQTRWINLPKNMTDALGEPDNLIPTSKDRQVTKGSIDGVSDALKKDMAELGIDGIDDLDELEEKNMASYNESGLVPPDDAGTFEKPILIPSRLDKRVVGYVDPTTHAVFWFTIRNDDAAYYLQDLGLFFKMMYIDDPEFRASIH